MEDGEGVSTYGDDGVDVQRWGCERMMVNRKVVRGILFDIKREVTGKVYTAEVGRQAYMYVGKYVDRYVGSRLGRQVGMQEIMQVGRQVGMYVSRQEVSQVGRQVCMQVDQVGGRQVGSQLGGM